MLSAWFVEQSPHCGAPAPIALEVICSTAHRAPEAQTYVEYTVLGLGEDISEHVESRYPIKLLSVIRSQVGSCPWIQNSNAVSSLLQWSDHLLKRLICGCEAQKYVGAGEKVHNVEPRYPVDIFSYIPDPVL